MMLDKATLLKKMLEADLIDRKQVGEAITRCKKQKDDLYEYLIRRLDESSEKINRFFLDNFNYHPIILNDIVLNPNIVNMVPTDLMVNHLINILVTTGGPSLSMKLINGAKLVTSTLKNVERLTKRSTQAGASEGDARSWFA